MITWDDIADLVAFGAVYDKRWRDADELDLKAWFAVAQLERWTRATVERIIVERYSRSRGDDRWRLEPAEITDRIRKLRNAAAESFEAPRIPEGLPNADYPAWLRAQLGRHVDAQLEQWAATGEEPSRAVRAGPAPIRTLKELVAAAPPHVREQIAESANRIQSRRIPDPDRRAEARRELDNRRGQATA